jgi:hypothetical protein
MMEDLGGTNQFTVSLRMATLAMNHTVAHLDYATRSAGMKSRICAPIVFFDRPGVKIKIFGL